MKPVPARAGTWRALALGALVGLLVPLAAVAQSSFEQQVDALLRQGHDRPDAALAAMQALDTAAAGASEKRLLLLARGMVPAQSGRDADALARVDTLRTYAGAAADAQADAAASLVQALAAQNAARLDVSATLAQAALDGLRPFCAALGPVVAAEPRGRARTDMAEPHAAPARCDHRVAWQALQILQHHAARSGAWADATAHARMARDLAAGAGDEVRLAQSAAELAWLTARSDSLDAALPHLHQAQGLAQHRADPWLLVHTKMAEARIASQRGEHDSVRRLAEEALALAGRAESPRLEAAVQALLSDAHAKQGRAADALRAAERALPIVRQNRDRPLEMVLTQNAGLAKISLGRTAEGLLDLARVEELAAAAGPGVIRAQVLREYDEALAKAGDARAALALYHRERELNAQAMQHSGEAALKQLQASNHRERQQRDIDMLERDNQLKAAALANRELMRRVWGAAALVLLLSAAVVALLYSRVRATHRQLVSSQAQLRVQSERDPLTNLANRRHFLSVMQTSRALDTASQGFEGALLLVDIDHFKHVNDGHGHAAGDLVLCEVARRLNEAVRGDDLVVRWGGEEFLVLALKAPAAMAEALAARILKAIGDAPVMVQGNPVQVTVSIGYARFPLPPNVLPVAWEQAINLADMALYTAKNQGRNRAVGIVAARAEAAPELRHIEADFDRAWLDGRVTLKVAPGPMAMA